MAVAVVNLAVRQSSVGVVFVQILGCPWICTLCPLSTFELLENGIPSDVAIFDTSKQEGIVMTHRSRVFVVELREVASHP